MNSFLYLVAVPAGLVLLWKLLKIKFPWLSEDAAFVKKIAGSLKMLASFKKQDCRPCDK